MKVEFLGVGAAFAFSLGNTSAVINDHILIDCGGTVPAELDKRGLLGKITDIIITHGHMDHMGGLEAIGLLSYFKYQRRPKLIAPYNIWETLKGGMENLISPHGAPLRATIDTYFDFQPLANDYGSAPLHTAGGLYFLTISKGDHVKGLDSFSLVLSDDKISTLVYTGDVLNLDHFMEHEAGRKNIAKADVIFSDCQLYDAGPGNVHVPFKMLQWLPLEIRKKMWLMHYGENWKDFETEAEHSGFKGFVGKGQIIHI